MGHETLADDAALAGQDLQDALGQPGLEGEFSDAQRAERRDLGRLEHHGVAGGQSRGEAPTGNGHGEVPGDDHPDHAQWLEEGDIETARHRDLPSAVTLGSAGIELDHIAYVPGLPAGVPEDMAGVGHLEVGQFVAMGVDRGGEATEQPGPVTGGYGPPGLEGGGRPLDGGVGLGRGQPIDSW